MQIIDRKTISLIKSLNDKKNRVIHKLFVVEGDKSVSEILNSKYRIIQLYSTKKFIAEVEKKIPETTQLIEVSKEFIKRASFLQNPQNCIALVQIPDLKQSPDYLPAGLTVYLDGIQDPGNLGTIIRTCDWFGIRQIICSPDTADLYNPKVIQASMGSFSRVTIKSTPLENVAKIAANYNIHRLGTYPDGKSIYTNSLPRDFILIMGNEGNGIRKENEKYLTGKISIPAYKSLDDSPESLNVAIATSIICSEYRRQFH